MELSSPEVTVREDPPCPRDPDKQYPAHLESVLIWTRNNSRDPRAPTFVWLKARYHADDNSWYATTDDDAYWVHDTEVMVWKRP